MKVRSSVVPSAAAACWSGGRVLRTPMVMSICWRWSLRSVEVRCREDSTTLGRAPGAGGGGGKSRRVSREARGDVGVDDGVVVEFTAAVTDDDDDDDAAVVGDG